MRRARPRPNPRGIVAAVALAATLNAGIARAQVSADSSAMRAAPARISAHPSSPARAPADTSGTRTARAHAPADLSGAAVARAQAPAPDTLETSVPPIVVTATRSPVPATFPGAVQDVDSGAVARALPAWGLRGALASVPGVYVSDRANLSLDQRISIRGFGARSAFAIRGIKLMVDGIPQTLPDGQGQLSNFDIDGADHIEVLRGAASSLFGNAAGGVISVWSAPRAAPGLDEQVRVSAGSFGDGRWSLNGAPGTWTRWSSVTRTALGRGAASLVASRLAYGGARAHSAAEARTYTGRVELPAGRWSLIALGSYADDPRADNPGALTLAEWRARPDSAAPANLRQDAGKSVRQGEAGLTLRRPFARGGEMDLTVFGFARRLRNPTTLTYIGLDRLAGGARWTVTRPLRWGAPGTRATLGFDLQEQRDDRVNTGNTGGGSDGVRTLDQLEHVSEVGPFAQLALALGARLALTLGARFDRVGFAVADRLVTPTNPDDSGRRTLSSPSGTAGLTWRPDDRLLAYANVGTSFETPTTTELANRPSGAGGFNPDLQPQRAAQVEVGARADLAPRLRGSLALYRSMVMDELIPFQVPGGADRVFYRNAGRARHQGVELSATFAPLAGLDLTGAWTYSDLRYVDYRLGGVELAGRELPGVPRHWLSLTLGIHPRSGAWASIETQYSSSLLVADTLAARPPAWWATNVRVGWPLAIGGRRLEPYAALDNLFDRRYVGSVVINAAGGRYYEPAPGRSVQVGVSTGLVPR